MTATMYGPPPAGLLGHPRGTATSPSGDAYASLKGLLDRYGLPSLTDWAWQQLVQGKSQDEITLSLYDQPAFKQRFPAIDARRAAGLSAISPAEYVAYEDQARQMMRATGFPPSFYDQPGDFTDLISKDVSLSELSQRASIYQKAAYESPPEVRQQLRDLYGIDEGHIAAYLADPERALPILQQQFTASQIAGQAQSQRFGQLTQTEAERLAGLGVTSDQARQGFATIANGAQLFENLPGQGTGAPGRNEALGLVAGDAASQQAVDAEARKRKATFGSGGGFATSQRGVAGLGSANT